MSPVSDCRGIRRQLSDHFGHWSTTIQYSEFGYWTGCILGRLCSVTVVLFLPSGFRCDHRSNTNSVFVANYGVGGRIELRPRVAQTLFRSLNVATNSMTNVAYLAPGAHPVALTETPNGSESLCGESGQQYGGRTFRLPIFQPFPRSQSEILRCGRLRAPITSAYMF
jgi:hypothetical protein